MFCGSEVGEEIAVLGCEIGGVVSGVRLWFRNEL